MVTTQMPISKEDITHNNNMTDDVEKNESQFGIISIRKGPKIKKWIMQLQQITSKALKQPTIFH